MCGRFIFLTDQDREEILSQMPEPLKTMEGTELINPRRGNIYPSQEVPVIIEKDERPVMRLMHWGYENPFEPKRLLINARSETADKKPMFRSDYKHRRCLIPATGFYEWNKEKEQYAFTDPGHLLFMGGIWKPGENGDDFLILTKEPDATVRPIHNRMPVLIPEADLTAWLDDPKDRKRLLQAYVSLEAKPVGQVKLTF